MDSNQTMYEASGMISESLSFTACILITLGLTFLLSYLFVSEMDHDYRLLQHHAEDYPRHPDENFWNMTIEERMMCDLTSQ